MNSEGAGYIYEETGIDITGDNVLWGVKLNAISIFTRNGVKSIPLESQNEYFADWITNNIGECFGMINRNLLELNDMDLFLTYDIVGIERDINVYFNLNGQEWPIIPEGYDIGFYVRGTEYLYYDGDTSIYLLLEYRGDLDEDDFIAIYSINSNEPYLISIEKTIESDFPGIDMMNILDNV